MIFLSHFSSWNVISIYIHYEKVITIVARLSSCNLVLSYTFYL
jgi:hypothetical protein